MNYDDNINMTVVDYIHLAIIYLRGKPQFSGSGYSHCFWGQKGVVPHVQTGKQHQHTCNVWIFNAQTSCTNCMSSEHVLGSQPKRVIRYILLIDIKILKH